MNKKEFVAKCGELLRIAKPHLVNTELKFGKEIEVKESMKQYEHYIPEEEYVVITCENGFSYKLNIEGNSLCAIAEEIFSKMAHK